MKVLFVVPRFHTNQLEWIKLLKEHDHELAIYAQFQGFTENYSELKPKIVKPSLLSKIRLDWIDNSKEKDNLKSIKRMKAFSPSILDLYFQIRSFNPDIVICRDRTKLTAVTNFLCKILGVKCVLYNQVAYYSVGDRSPVKRLLNKLIFPKYRMTPVLGNESNTDMVNNTFYIPFAINSNNKIEREYLRDNRINILSIGKFYERKNHAMLIRVCKRLIEDDLNIHLTIIGENSNQTNEDHLKKIKGIISEEKIDDYITIKTNISHELVSEEYFKNDIFVLASTKEQAAVSHLEAMAHGLLSICSNTNGTASYIEDGKTGYIFNDMDQDDLYSKLRYICMNSTNIKTMGENSLHHIEKKHSGKAIYKRYEELFEKTLEH
ncbi:glycosyltransferase family 4 protein [Bacillus thuringiensis]|nr:glycosyltransferase family 4 protein [Bacillus thuringiensis]